MTWQPSSLEEQRLSKLERLRDADVDPYPRRVERTHHSEAAKAAFAAAEADGEAVVVTVTGRLVSMRDMGKSVFAHIEDGYGRIQLFVRREEVGEETHLIFRKLLDLGDFVQATGLMFHTRSGEMSVRVSEWKLLSKAVSPLPVVKEEEVDGELVRHSAFSNVEERYRQRYADLAVNPEVRELFRARANIISAVRGWMDSHEFLEVETPVLQPLYGGAAARPFTTHHNQLKQELYLRISFELYLKRLLVGGLERVYEIGRDFRNEGVSFKHNPEFTMIEFYAAYWDYEDVMRFTQGMVQHVADKTLGSQTLTYQGTEINLGGNWARMTMREAIIKYAEIDYMEYLDADSLAKAMRNAGEQAPPGASWGKLIDALFGDFVEPNLIQPTFITQYPRDISPLAKAIPGDPLHVERFEYFIAGMEMGNAFTELNDPLDQQQRFEDLQKMYAQDDDEINPIDEDYLKAMRYGMPPNGGFGAGIDRMVMLFTDKSTIREIILFPHLRERV